MTAELTPAQVADFTGAHQPTDEQAAVIGADLAPSAIVAGAGSGKTETMAARVVWLVCNGKVDPDRVLGLTFTRKAASELAERVRKRLREAARLIPELSTDLRESMLRAEPTILTYDSYARRIVQEHGLRLGIEPSVQTADAASLWQLAERIVNEYEGPLEELAVTAEKTIIPAVVHLSDEMAAHMVDLDKLADQSAEVFTFLESIERAAKKPVAPTNWGAMKGIKGRPAIAPVLERFARAKAERDLMSFGDILQAACALSAQFAAVGEAERARYDVVLLDEYQDTSGAQALLLKNLFAGHPITAVGDPCQAIYGFRGASADTLPAFRSEFAAAGAAVELQRLQTSFRNDRAILAVANAVSEPLLAAGADVAVLRPGPGAADGELAVGYFRTVEDEAAAVAADIAGRWKPDGSTSVAVLCRARSDEFGAAVDALLDAGLPVEVVGLSGLLALAEVREVVQTLRVLTRPDSAPDLVQLLGGRRWAIGPADLMRLRSYAHRLAGRYEVPDADDDEVDSASLVDALDQIEAAGQGGFSDTGWQRLTEYARELRELRRLMGEPLADLIGAIERAIGVDVETTVRDLRRGSPPRSALDQLTSVAQSFSGSAGTESAEAFLQYLEAAEEADRGITIDGLVPRTDAVQVLTMHAAKGLEWDAVYVVGATDNALPGKPRPAMGWVGDIGTLPYNLRGDSRALPQHRLFELARPDKIKAEFLEPFKAAVEEHHEQEQRRLVYVAVTRARHRLWMSGAQWKAGTQKPRDPAVYLELVRDHAERAGGEPVHWEPPAADDADNPCNANPAGYQWPASRLSKEQVEARAARELLEEGAPSGDVEHPWLEATELLLAERAARRKSSIIDVEAPSRLSASQLVAISRDPAQFARDIRRPVPRGIAREADRGTLFHSWVEHRFGSESLIDIDQLPGAGDEGIEADESIDDLIAAFEASEWADRRPVETEAGFDLMLDGIPLRGRLDAVFDWPGEDADYDYIDWKTGRLPKGEALRAAEVQLAVYRLAWARIKGIPPERVRAGFFYVADGVTHRPSRVLDEAGLVALVRSLPEAATAESADPSAVSERLVAQMTEAEGETAE